MTPYFERDGIVIYHGDCRDVLPTIEAGSVQLAITSPAYFATREYGTDPREIGRESNPAAYVHNLVAITDLIAATVHQRGNLFVNLGDKTNADGPIKSVQTGAGYPRARRQPRWPGMSLKSLMLLPQRYAIACVDDLGLALRAEIVWEKGAGGADGKAVDRVRRAHELIFHFTHRLKHGQSTDVFGFTGSSVWKITPTGQRGGHNADYPLSLPNRIIEGWSAPGHLVIDPFMGTGTTLDAARNLGRRAIGVDLEERFCEQVAVRLDRASEAS